MMHLLKAMMKEEWRMHSTMFGNLMFSLFPLLIFIFTFLGNFLYHLLSNIISFKNSLLTVLLFFFFFGLSVGSFGLLGREVMNRRFGQASLVAYSSRALPISEKKIFTVFFIKDVIYYFLFWILPFSLGISLYSFVNSIHLFLLFKIITSVSISFLLGLTLSFLLSTIYVHHEKLAMYSFFFLVITIIFLNNFFNIDLLIYFLPFTIFNNFNFLNITTMIIFIIISTIISISFLKVDYHQDIKIQNKNYFKEKNIIDNVIKNIFVKKDFIDMKRSRVSYGKLIFAFIFPLIFIWIILKIFITFFPFLNFIFLFSIFFGMMSSTIYNFLTEFELFSNYSFLPIKVSTIILSKIKSYFIINLISPLILLLIIIKLEQISSFIISLLLLISFSIYGLTTTIFLTGLHPNILLYNTKVFLLYIIYNLPVMLLFLFISAFFPNYLCLCILMIPFSIIFIRISLKKWDNKQEIGF
ncbi:hypothetical protein HOD20_03865 [archaeon]|jgi:hypothetical protein|nr:hypothetical protein [archaeon]MBT4351639.1 hypothetical protein [archaeon]MBT4647380.1 hypothetical protein [archaeon]MBT6821383.1 hypothetical protein [archaeon]MBT7392836.1 hypothetical protein [archaeon]